MSPSKPWAGRRSSIKKHNSIVRVEAHRLRKRLREYYASEGANHSVWIHIPCGQYAPQFVRQPRPELSLSVTAPAGACGAWTMLVRWPSGGTRSRADSGRWPAADSHIVRPRPTTAVSAVFQIPLRIVGSQRLSSPWLSAGCSSGKPFLPERRKSICLPWPESLPHPRMSSYSGWPERGHLYRPLWTNLAERRLFSRWRRIESAGHRIAGTRDPSLYRKPPRRCVLV